MRAAILTEFQVKAGWGFGRPESQGVDAVVGVSGNRTVEGHGEDSLNIKDAIVNFIINLQ